MNVDPVVPPVDRVGVIAEKLLFFRHKSKGKFFDVFGHKVMLVEKNKRLEQLDQLFNFLKLPSGAIAHSERRLLTGFISAALID